jgi:hypothetical protein
MLCVQICSIILLSVFSIGQSTACDISVPSSLDYDTDVLRGKLKENGYIPGPIIPTTKRLYLRKLLRLQRKPVQVSSKTKGWETFSYFMMLC